ncbi:MAG: hypothetical protein ACJAT2_002331 [Bacteriovoracaceae bacterium]
MMSLILNMGLILVSFNRLKNRFRITFTVWMFISLVGVTLTVGGVLPYMEYLSVLFHLWIISTIWRNNENQISACA